MLSRPQWWLAYESTANNDDIVREQYYFNSLHHECNTSNHYRTKTFHRFFITINASSIRNLFRFSIATYSNPVHYILYIQKLCLVFSVVDSPDFTAPFVDPSNSSISAKYNKSESNNGSESTVTNNNIINMNIYNMLNNIKLNETSILLLLICFHQ